MIWHIILSFNRLFYNLVDYVFLRRSLFERFFSYLVQYLCSIKDSLDSMTGRLTEVDLSEVPPQLLVASLPSTRILACYKCTSKKRKIEKSFLC